MDNVTRPALGQIVPIGTFYDARLDRFHDTSLLSREPASGGISQHVLKKSDVRVDYGESYAEGFKAMDIGLDLAASLLSGSSPTSAIARTLVNKEEDARTLQALICHATITMQERLELTNPNIKQCLSTTHLRTSMATHVVTEIEYGAQTILTATRWLNQDVKKDSEKAQFQQQITLFVDAVRNVQNGTPYTSSLIFDQIRARSSILGSDEIVFSDTNEALKFLELIPLQIKIDKGRGSPVIYKLLPIQMLNFLSLVQVEADVPQSMASQDCLKKFIQLCDEYRKIEPTLTEYQTFSSRYQFCLPPGHSDEVARRIDQLKANERDLKASFARTLHDVRRGVGDSDALWQVLKDFGEGSRSPTALSASAHDYQWKVAFIDDLLTSGATYIGYNSPSLESQLARRGNVESYVLSFSEEARKDSESWSANQALMLSLLQNRKPSTFFAILDCDAIRAPLEKSIISQYENGKVTVTDFYEEQEFIAGVCLARFHPQSLETKDVQKPTKRCLVKIPCPGSDCSAGDICEWCCSACFAQLEFGYADQFIYCDCGRSVYNSYDFKCNSVKHGPGYDRYNDTNLLNFLKSLDQSDYLNILILGETGVGKSTFINAFVNYLYFSTLDDALNAEGLHSVIPCSFTIQNKQKIGDRIELQETNIKVGSRAGENDGSGGNSATQQTQVYPISVGASTYRLIDTPGIGDTRGIALDKKNMVDILATVAGYDHLHGILILLKSNQSRMTPTFAFCVKELLSHLHRDATHNVVWGFTNTRISNYTPGDTWGSLKKLLSEDSEIGISLAHETAYCFDSESFRYLAAFKEKGVIMENKPEFVSSWNRSREEAERMLAYFRTKKPHPVKSTLSLNGTRTLITELTKPMAEISKQIRANIATMEDEKRELGDVRLSGDKLKQKLRPELTYLRLKPTVDPRTVCTGQGCVEQQDDGTGNNMITHYPNPCHAPCGLNNIPPGVLAFATIQGCAAFRGNQECQRCSHHWTLHMHFFYELESYKDRITDQTVEQKIKAQASDIQLREAGIQSRNQLIAECKAEHKKIQAAAANFGLWMKANSILPINDATLAYLEILIKNEQAKVDAGGIANKKVLADLEEDKRKHEELVKILEASMKNTGQKAPINQDEVEAMVKSLYKLKHFGKTLEELQVGITKAHEMTNRELPHRINPRHMGRGSHSRSASSPGSRHYPQSHGHSHGGGRHNHNGYLQPSMGSSKLQRPQSTNPGFASGTMRPGTSGGYRPVPGSFMDDDFSSNSKRSSIGRQQSQKQKSSGFSYNPLNLFKS